VIKCAVRLTIPCQVNLHASIRKDKPVIACKTVEYEPKSLVSLNIAGALEKLIERGCDAIF